MAKVSVIIPVFNKEEFLPQCLMSVLSQTLDDIEVICVNDGSTDSSLAILERHASNDRRVVLIDQENKGVGEARNVGLRAATGDFIAFMDPDDYYPDANVVLDLYYAARMSNMSVCGGSFCEDHSGQIKSAYPAEYADYTFTEEKIVEYADYQFDFGYTRFIFDRRMLIDNGVFFPRYIRFQDPPFFVRAMLTAGRFYALKRLTYCYRYGHQKLVWNRKRTLDMVLAVTENILLSNQWRYAKLHYLSILRLERIKDAIAQNLTTANMPLFKAAIAAQEAIDPILARQYKPDFSENYVLQPLARLLPAPEAAATAALRRMANASKQPESTEQLQIIRIEGEIRALKDSKSFRVGRVITFLPRKVRTFVMLLRHGGLAAVRNRIRELSRDK